MKKHRAIVQTILRRYPETQAVYLFGSWGTGDEWAHSDVDIAVLLPVRTEKKSIANNGSDWQAKSAKH